MFSPSGHAWMRDLLQGEILTTRGDGSDVPGCCYCIHVRTSPGAAVHSAMDESRSHLKPGSAASLNGVTVCYVSTERYGGVWRTYKQARSLSDAGARVVVAGYEEMIPEPLTREPFEVVAVQGPARLSAVIRHPWLFVSAIGAYTRNHLLGTKWRKEHPPASQRLRHRLLSDAVAHVGADVIQAIDLVSLECAHRAARECGARLVYASNELWSEFVRNPDTGFSDVIAERLLNVERAVIGDADLVIAVSEPMAQQMVRQYGIPTPLVLLNAPPHKVDAARPVSSPVRLVFHGGLSVDRNIDGLIRAMAELSDIATLDVHGRSRTADLEDLQDLAEGLGLGSVVTLHGPFDYEHVVDIIGQYDVGVMAARIHEGNGDIAMPNKVLDCMCAGLAIAMNGSTAIDALLDEAPFGITLDSSSVDTIARDLRVLLIDPEWIMDMKRAAVEAAPRYWWPVQGEKLVRAFQAMLDE